MAARVHDHVRLIELGSGARLPQPALICVRFSDIELFRLVHRAETLTQLLSDASEKGFPLDARSIENIGRAEARRNRWGNLALWIIAAVLVAFALHVL